MVNAFLHVVEGNPVVLSELLGELVVVSGEEGAALLLSEEVDDGAGDGAAVVRRGATAEFVDHDQRGTRYVTQDIGGLGHL